MPGVPVDLWWLHSCATITLCARGCGCSGHPAFPTPSVGRKIHAHLGRIAPRDRALMFEIGKPSLRGAKRRSNPFFLYVARWIASRSLSSGAHSRDTRWLAMTGLQTVFDSLM